MDTEHFNELKDSICQMKAIEKGELAPALVRVATKYPEQVLECAEDSAAYNSKQELEFDYERRELRENVFEWIALVFVPFAFCS